MATPIYKGAGQPVTAGGWLSGLASWFGRPAPVYAGNQTAQGSTGLLGSAVPAYKPAPTSNDGSVTAPSASTDSAREPAQITVIFPRELIEPQQ
jgi:hypothetical protein